MGPRVGAFAGWLLPPLHSPEVASRSTCLIVTRQSGPVFFRSIVSEASVALALSAWTSTSASVPRSLKPTPEKEMTALTPGCASFIASHSCPLELPSQYSSSNAITSTFRRYEKRDGGDVSVAAFAKLASVDGSISPLRARRGTSDSIQ